jgi:catechol 2,3-dioxygenase-like lactoylglutathione lyase family enzyme
MMHEKPSRSTAPNRIRIVKNLYARTVFFAKDAERALKFYTETLGFAMDWNYQEQGRACVFQVSLLGFELILNQTGPATEARAGHGRLFIGLEDDQAAAFRKHIEEKSIQTTVVDWGNPTLVIRDLDENELFFWLPERERANLQARPGDASPAVADGEANS